MMCCDHLVGILAVEAPALSVEDAAVLHQIPFDMGLALCQQMKTVVLGAWNPALL